MHLYVIATYMTPRHVTPEGKEEKKFATIKEALDYEKIGRNSATAAYIVEHYKPEWDSCGISSEEIQFIFNMVSSIETGRINDPHKHIYEFRHYFDPLFEYLDARVAHQGVQFQRDPENANAIKNKLAITKRNYVSQFQRSMNRSDKFKYNNLPLAPRDLLGALEELLCGSFGEVIVDSAAFNEIKKEILGLIDPQLDAVWASLRSQDYSRYASFPRHNLLVLAFQLANKLLASAKLVEKPPVDIRQSNKDFLDELWKI